METCAKEFPEPGELSPKIAVSSICLRRHQRAACSAQRLKPWKNAQHMIATDVSLCSTSTVMSVVGVVWTVLVSKRVLLWIKERSEAHREIERRCRCTYMSFTFRGWISSEDCLEQRSCRCLPGDHPTDQKILSAEDASAERQEQPGWSG